MSDVGPILIMVFLFAGVLLIVAVICTAGSSVKPPRAYGYHVDLADLAGKPETFRENRKSSTRLWKA